MNKRKHHLSKRNHRRVTSKWANPMSVDPKQYPAIDLGGGDNDDDDIVADHQPSSADPDSSELRDGRDDGRVSTTMTSMRTVSAKVRKQKNGLKQRMRQRQLRQQRAARSRPKSQLRAAKYTAAVTLGPNSKLEPSDVAIRSLWRCNSVDDVKATHLKWSERFNVKCMKAIEKRKLSNDTRIKIAALVDGSATGTPLLTSHQVLALTWEALHRAVWARTKDDLDIEFALVTFVYGEGGTSLNEPVITPQRSDSLVLKVVRKMAMQFIGVSEQAMFNSHGHPDGGRHLQDHQHVIIWGKGVVAKAKAVALRWMSEFSPNITGAPQIDIRLIPKTELNLARVFAYLFKSPHKCMNWNPPRDGKPGHMNQSEKGDRMIRYLRMAEVRSMMTVEDIMFAGGDGVKIRSDVIKLVRQTCQSAVPVQNRHLHPDGIGRFWVGVNVELKRPQWKLPVIARQP